MRIHHRSNVGVHGATAGSAPRWASHFTPPVASNPPKMLGRKLHHQPVAAPRDKDPRKTRRRDRRAVSQMGRGGGYIFFIFIFFFFLPFMDFAIAALGAVAAIGAVASDPDFAAAPPLVPLAPPVCAKPPAADKANTMAAAGMISARIYELPS